MKLHLRACRRRLQQILEPRGNYDRVVRLSTPKTLVESRSNVPLEPTVMFFLPWMDTIVHLGSKVSMQPVYPGGAQ